MPTGYTYRIIDEPDLTFSQFALDCARAFGACIDLRDEPRDTPILDEFKPSSYHQEALATAKKTVSYLQGLTHEQRVAFGESEKLKRRQGLVESREKCLLASQRLQQMRLQVAAWEPPSPDHVELKNFMLSQIDDTIKHDGSVSYEDTRLRDLEAQGPLEFYGLALAAACAAVPYHEKRLAEDIKRANERTLWVRQLRESLQEVSK